MSVVDQFVQNHNNQLINNRGIQCVALANQYEQEVVGGGIIPTPLTGYAKDLWNVYPNSAVDQNNYIRVTPDQPAQKGDLAVWDRYATSGLPHVALVLSDNGGNLSCFTQNPLPAHVENLSKSGLDGYLRPRKFVVAAPAPAPANTNTGDMYHLGAATPGYVNSSDALHGQNSNSTVPAGDYSVFNRANGVINITTQAGQPGWWVNPGTIAVEVPAPQPPAPAPNGHTDNGTTFSIGHEVPGYVTADDAMAGRNSNSTVPVGSYAVFNRWHGAINVTRQAGVPGWWFNPGA